MNRPLWLLFGLNLFDGWATMRGLAAGTMREGNPLLDGLLRLSPPLAWSVKLVGLPILLGLVLTVCPRRKWVQRALWLAAVIYGAVGFRHLAHLLI